MEGHRQVHHQRWIAFRPDVAVHQRQPAQPAYRLHLSAVRIHQVLFRLRALLYAAGVGRGGARQYRPVHQHDGSTPQRRNKSGAAGTLAYFDAGTDQNIPFGCNKPAAKDCTDLDLVDVYYKIATEFIDKGNFGQALVLSGVVEGIEFTAKFHSGNFQAYCLAPRANATSV
jgi:hypothetical protein